MRRHRQATWERRCEAGGDLAQVLGVEVGPLGDALEVPGRVVESCGADMDRNQ